MATSGTVKTAIANTQSYFYVDWSQASQSVNDNSTTINWTLTLYCGTNKWYTNAVRIDYVKINGTQVKGSETYSNQGDGSSGWHSQKASGTLVIPHNSDGSKSFTIEISSWFYQNGTKTGSGSFTLNTIPRASTMTVPSTMTMGTETTFTITKTDSSFKHKITYTFGSSGSGTVYSVGTGVTVQWTPSTDLGSQIPSANQGTITFVLTTYKSDGTTQVGTKSYTSTLKILSYTPDFTLSTSLDNSANSTIAGWGVAVKGLTKINYSISGNSSSMYGASISSYSVTIQATNETKTTASGTSGYCSQVGSGKKVVATITDTRGKTRTKESTGIEVYDYASPIVSQCSAFRCLHGGTTKNDSGTFLYLKCTATLGTNSTIGNRNSLIISYETSAYESGTLTSGTALELNNGDATNGGYLATDTYVVTITVSDTVGTSIVRTFNIPTELVTFHMKEGGKAVAFSTYATEDDTVNFGTWHPYGYILGLGKAKRQLSSENLNSIITPGIYGVSSNSDASSLTNCPSSYAGTLRVWNGNGAKTIGGTWHYVMQEYIDINGDIYIRGGNSDSTANNYTWKTWKHIAMV